MAVSNETPMLQCYIGKCTATLGSSDGDGGRRGPRREARGVRQLRVSG